jgi:hypothetical protein
MEFLYLRRNSNLEPLCGPGPYTAGEIVETSPKRNMIGAAGPRNRAPWSNVMSIRQALRKQAVLASQPRAAGKPAAGQGAAQRWCGSNAILALMAVVLAVVCIVEMLRG